MQPAAPNLVYNAFLTLLTYTPLTWCRTISQAVWNCEPTPKESQIIVLDPLVPIWFPSIGHLRTEPIFRLFVVLNQVYELHQQFVLHVSARFWILNNHGIVYQMLMIYQVWLPYAFVLLALEAGLAAGVAAFRNKGYGKCCCVKKYHCCSWSESLCCLSFFWCALFRCVPQDKTSVPSDFRESVQSKPNANNFLKMQALKSR